MSNSRRWPLLTAILILIGVTLLLAWLIVKINRGVFTYTLDDAYIHMSMAKNFAVHGVWGVTPYHFSSSSSSLLWTFLLALLYKLLGVGVWQPLALNLIAGILLLISVDWMLRSEGVGGNLRLATLLAVVFFMSMSPLSLMGQEHILHTLISVLFLYLSAVRLAEPSSASRSIWPALALLSLAAFLTAARYEGLFLVFAVGLIFLAKRKWLDAILLGAAGLFPITLYGLISLSNGWYFFPNSVLLKGRTANLGSFRVMVKSALFFVQRLNDTAYLLLLLIGVVALIYFSFQLRGLERASSSRGWLIVRYMGLAYVVTLLLHTQFAVVGSMTPLSRYDAYLVALGVLIVTLGVHALDLRPARGGMAQSLALLALGIILLLPLLERGGYQLLSTPPAANNIYEQQYQMGQFARMFYRGQGVAVNDIGTINFEGDIRGFDLWGLATLEVAQARRDNTYNVDVIDRLTREQDVKIAIVYDPWFTKYGGLPEGWVKAGAWTDAFSKYTLFPVFTTIVAVMWHLMNSTSLSPVM